MSEKVVPSDEPARLPGRFPFSFGGGAAPAIARAAAAPREERIAALGYFDAVQAIRGYLAVHAEERARLRVIPYHGGGSS
ncbi:MAG: hypothetical protein ACREXK_08450 [Gammaproteobacteria bacterium]